MSNTLSPVQKFELALTVYGQDLPTPAREFQFCRQRKWRFDYCWGVNMGRDNGGAFLPLLRMVAVEIDGGGWSSRGGGKHGLDRDKEKLNVAAALGWRVIRLSGSLLDDSEYCINLVRSALHGSTPPLDCAVVQQQAAKQNAKNRARRQAAKAARS